MIEELISDQKKLPMTPQKQEELIKKYCTGIEDRIRAARAESDEAKFIDNVCKGLEQECESGVIRSFLPHYVHSLYEIH